MESVDVAVIGGGVSGLAAAYEALKREQSVIVLERETRAGGIIQTERVGEFVIDAGPDALLVQKPAAIALCNELGLGDRLVSTKLPRTAFVLRNATLHPLPGASMLGFPTRMQPLLASTLFSWPAKLRMAAERIVPRRPKRLASADESIADFVRRRFGPEAVTYIAEPLLAGIHAGEVERLSMHALFPRLVDAERRSGSVMRAFRRERGSVNTDGAFRSFPHGLGELIDALLHAIPKASIRTGSNVTAIEKGDGFRIHVGGKPAIHARSVILATPAFAAADLLRPLDRDLSMACGSIRYLSTATVVFAFPRESVHHNLMGTGFVVPRAEGISITAGAWISSKWPQRAPEGHALLRAFLGGARDPDVLSKTDEELAEAALRDLTKILDIRGLPTLTRVYRWNRASPQQDVGHADLMKRIDLALERHPGLFISAAGFRGVGIPDCVADARATAASAAAFVTTR
ncbi:MAG TPA: protoporphyrinogen oxidase [Vicinamibacterales bacterium]|nr:protoporphyrinogen oxidase [Vicinamibacterales bacterium]